VAASYADVLNANGVVNFGASNTGSSPGVLSVSSASTSVTVGNVSTTFSGSIHQVTLTGTVSSPTGGLVNEGTVTFTVGNLPPVVATVNGQGAVQATINLPAGLAAGNYTINASYADTTNANGTVNFTPSTAIVPGTLTVGTASTTTSVNALVIGFSTSGQLATLTANVTNPNGGTVNEGTVTFTAAGQTLTAGVSGGIASAVLTIPANFPIGTTAITATFADAPNANGQLNYSGSSGSAPLVVNPAATTITITHISISPGFFGPSQETVTVAVNGPNGPVSGGTVTINVGGTTVTAGVSGGQASATVSVSTAGPQGISASFSGGGNLAGSSTSRSAFLNWLSAFFPTTVTINADGSETVVVDFFFFLPITYVYDAAGNLVSTTL
jgi:hypothetical protein